MRACNRFYPPPGAPLARAPKPALKNARSLMLAALLTSAFSASAEIQVAASHTRVALEPGADSTVLTIDLTLRNSGDVSLSGVSLAPAGAVFAASDRLSVGDLHAGAEQSRRWVLHSTQTEQVEALVRYLGMNLSATDASGAAVVLNLGSLEVE